ncbi:hypothetical protein BESB_073090 [Besnoitia besnoiti]|uniref:PCI domain-containing protein n=1 Tax=Besnoitia besnoiti TaxID=94643 RepID=A0A2A9MEV0_BESBE|nr:uncharacterized protein BESB_073090 [Besnoitia besnoiti]PFH34157.1 hypothetical protein BESB_073090 [Besnoitia besnoiti]
MYASLGSPRTAPSEATGTVSGGGGEGGAEVTLWEGEGPVTGYENTPVESLLCTMVEPTPPLSSPSFCSVSSACPSSEAVVQHFLHRLDQVEERPHSVAEVLLHALTHPLLCFFSELLGHPKVAGVRRLTDDHDSSRLSCVTPALPSFGLPELLATMCLFSTGTVEDYREGQARRRLMHKTGAAKTGGPSLAWAAEQVPALPPLLLKKLRMLTTLTLASYAREIPFEFLASALSVLEEDVAPDAADAAAIQSTAAPHGATDRATSESMTQPGEGVSVEALRAFLESAVAAKARVSHGEAVAVVRWCTASGWLRARVDEHRQIVFVEGVIGRDVDSRDDLELMEESLKVVARRAYTAIEALQSSIGKPYLWER